MLSTNQQSTKLFCQNEYDTLKRVILCQPQYMKIRQVINEKQKQFAHKGIHIELALEQHQQFVQTLQEHDVEVIFLPYHKKYPEQVFTRDIGFTIGETMFVAELAHDVRIGEQNVLKQWLEDDMLPYYDLVGDQIEGGDVLVDGQTIYIGLSNRTNQQAIDHLQRLLTHLNVMTIPFKEQFLHLDCVFNIVSPEVALVYPDAFSSDYQEMFASKYDIIHVNEYEQKNLGTNVLVIDQGKLVSDPSNKDVNKQLRDRGIKVIEVDFSEIIKSDGSFRCCTLPILRETK